MKTKNIFLATIILAFLSLVGCKKETITLSSYELWFPIEADTTIVEITSNCDWTLSIDDNADWYTVTPMTSKNENQGFLTIAVQPMEDQEYRTSSFTIVSAKGNTSVKVKVSQKKETFSLSKYELWFPTESGSKTLEINSNCKWTISIDDGADWYTVTPMSGEQGKPENLTVTVQPYEGTDFRSSSFTITSEHGLCSSKVYLSQNKLEFEEIINMVFGASKVEHWNTDYFGQMIEDSYKHKEYNPYDTTKGYMMYFLEDGIGVQRDHHEDYAVYYLFTYEYDAINRNLHIEFETATDTTEEYNASVLTASEDLFRFIHEYKPNWWERVDMSKIGTVTPAEKSLLMRNIKKRKAQNSIFIIE